MTGDEILALIEQVFPRAASMGVRITHLDEDSIEVVLPQDERFLRPGGTISGPTMMTMADTTMYFLVLARIGPQPLAVTTSLNINFLRKPALGDLHARARLPAGNGGQRGELLHQRDHVEALATYGLE